MAITAAGMRALRSAATLIDVLPRARVQLRDGDRTLLTVDRSRPEHHRGGKVIPPCAFRAAVGHAHRCFQPSMQLEFLDLPAGREPAIHLGLPAGDAVLPGHIYRLRGSGTRFLLLFVTVLPTDRCRDAVAEGMATTTDPVPSLRAHPSWPRPAGSVARRIGFHADPVTEMTTVHALSTADDLEETGALMTRLLEVCVATEMIAELEAL